MATTITAAYQLREEQAVAPEIDVSLTDSPTKTEVDAAIDTLNTQGYFGHVPPEGS